MGDCTVRHITNESNNILLAETVKMRVTNEECGYCALLLLVFVHCPRFFFESTLESTIFKYNCFS